ncbi:KRAB-A domain-containing protein 2 [Trichonephila clavipes]|nr:KRAB-A domain-containing protein 2 [Trichonephila clavipes]
MKSVSAIVMENSGKGFFRLGTRVGRIKQLYSRSQFRICERELISIEEVPNIDTTFRSVATAQSCGARLGFKKCSGTKMCNSKKCACFKNNV